jgi:hypothetical protein
MESPPLSAPFQRQGQPIYQDLEIDSKEAFYLESCESTPRPDEKGIPRLIIRGTRSPQASRTAEATVLGPVRKRLIKSEIYSEPRSRSATRVQFLQIGFTRVRTNSATARLGFPARLQSTNAVIWNLTASRILSVNLELILAISQLSSL